MQCRLLLPIVAGTMLAAASVHAATPKETLVAFRTAAGHYVSTVPMGGLDASSKTIGERGAQIFTLIDLNGGDLKDGDTVQIEWPKLPPPGTTPAAKPPAPAKPAAKAAKPAAKGAKPAAPAAAKPARPAKPTYWQENKDSLNRIGGHPTSACVFKVKWKQPNKSLTLQTASGKFVSAPADGKALVTTAKQSDPTAVFELIKNPTPPAAKKG